MRQSRRSGSLVILIRDSPLTGPLPSESDSKLKSEPLQIVQAGELLFGFCLGIPITHWKHKTPNFVCLP